MPCLATLRSALLASATWQAVALRNSFASLEDALEVEASDVNMTWNVFSKPGPKMTDVPVGSFGNSHFFASLAAVANTHPKVIEKIFDCDPTMAGPGLNTYGRLVYYLRFWLNGKESFVPFDDVVPMRPKGSDPRLFAGFSKGGSVWPALIEKGFAKLVGSYFGIGDYPFEALQAISRAPVDHLFQTQTKSWDEPKIWEFIKTAVDNTWPVEAGTSELAHTLGLGITEAAYAVTGAGIKQGKKAIQVYNAGNGNDPSSTSKQYTGELKDLQDEDKYWMTLTEFMSAFTSLSRARLWADGPSYTFDTTISTGAPQLVVLHMHVAQPFYVEVHWPTERLSPTGCKYNYTASNLMLRVARQGILHWEASADIAEAQRTGFLRVYVPVLPSGSRYDIMAMVWFEDLPNLKEVSLFVYSQDPSTMQLEKHDPIQAHEIVNRVFGTCDLMKWHSLQYTISEGETFRGSPVWKSRNEKLGDTSFLWVEGKSGLKLSESKAKFASHFADYKAEDVQCGWQGPLAFLNNFSLAQSNESHPASALAQTDNSETEVEVCDAKALKAMTDRLSRKRFEKSNFHELFATEYGEDDLFPPSLRSICGDEATGEKKAKCEKMNSWGSINVEFGTPRPSWFLPAEIPNID